MRVLIIYDNNGTIFMQSSGSELKEPQGGVQYMIVDVPVGKQIIGVDVSVTPHQPIFEDIPPSEIDWLKERVDEHEQAMLELTIALAAIQGGGD